MRSLAFDMVCERCADGILFAEFFDFKNWFHSEQGRYYTEVGGLKWEQRQAFGRPTFFLSLRSEAEEFIKLRSIKIDRQANQCEFSLQVV